MKELSTDIIKKTKLPCPRCESTVEGTLILSWSDIQKEKGNKLPDGIVTCPNCGYIPTQGDIAVALCNIILGDEGLSLTDQ